MTKWAAAPSFLHPRLHWLYVASEEHDRGPSGRVVSGNGNWKGILTLFRFPEHVGDWKDVRRGDSKGDSEVCLLKSLVVDVREKRWAIARTNPSL